MKNEVLQEFTELIKTYELSPEEIVHIIGNIVDTDKLEEFIFYIKLNY